MLSQIILNDIEDSCCHIEKQFFKDKIIVITGASGLIGTYFLAYMASLLKKGISIEAYALTYSDPPPHILSLTSYGKIKLLRIDLADAKEYNRLPEADIIIHSAGYAQPMIFMTNPVVTMQINISATIALLRRLKPHGSFIFLSSSEVYSGLKGPVFSEDHIGTSTPYHPRAAYIEGKRSGEAACNAFRAHDVRAISARMGDIYGPGTRKHDQRALNSFIEKALFQQKIALLDSGAAMRSYCYVADAVALLLKILCSGKHAVYNVGGHTYISIAQLAKLIGEITNSPVIMPTSDNTNIPGAPDILPLDLTRIETEFGKTKYVDIKEGLKRTVAWQRELYGFD